MDRLPQKEAARVGGREERSREVVVRADRNRDDQFANTHSNRHVEKKEELRLVERLLLSAGKVRSELDVRSSGGSDLAPQVGGQEGVSLGDGLESSLQEVTHGSGLTAGLGVAVLDTSELEHALRGRGGNDTGTTGSGHKTAHDRSSLTGDLHGDGVGLTESVTPVTTTNGDGGELGNNDGTTDGSSDFLGTLDTETEVTIRVTTATKALKRVR